jgi:hypothetical protein
MKRRVLAAWGLSIAAVIALAVSLHDLRLRPAMPLQVGSPAVVPPLPTGPEASLDILALLRGLLIVAAGVLLLVIVVNLFSREGRRRLLSLAVAFLVVLFVQTLLSLVPPPKRVPVQAATPAAPTLPAPSAGSAVSVPFEPEPPRWLPVVLLAGGALLAAAGATVVILFALRRRPPAVRARLAERSRAASDEISRGGDVRNVILRCYREMVVLVEEARGIARGTAVTPGEFAALLESAGLPAPPVRGLTSVFEEVRYGNADPSPETERRAIRSLDEITRFCGDPP